MSADANSFARLDAHTSEHSAVVTLGIGGAGTLLSGPAPGAPGLLGAVATVVAGAVVVGAVCLAVGLLGRRTALPFPRTWAANAAVALGFGAVTVNGLLSARSAWIAEGPVTVLAFVALVALAVGGLLGGLIALGWTLDA